jgi:hypothetical protein
MLFRIPVFRLRDWIGGSGYQMESARLLKQQTSFCESERLLILLLEYRGPNIMLCWLLGTCIMDTKSIMYATHIVLPSLEWVGSGKV